MSATPVRDLYESPNGDRWVLCQDGSGRLVVSHYPNRASGGRPTETELDVFLSQSRGGPEHQALIATLATLNVATDDNKIEPDLPLEAVEKLSRALGQAVARSWSTLPQDIQHDLFEQAVEA